MQHHSLFSDKSDLYERARPTYPESVYQYLASQCSADSIVWDCACGNGQAAIGLAKHFKKVYATDVSEQQIAHAKRRDNVIYSRSSAEASGFENQSFDLVCVAQALHWFDYSRFWPELKRVMKPGAAFATWAYHWCTVTPTIDALVQESVLDIIEPYWAEQNKIVWNEYRDVDFPFTPVNQKPAPFKMTAEMNLSQFFDFLHTFSATRRYMDGHGDEFFRNAYTRAAAVWGDPKSTKALSFDLIFYIGLNK